MKSGQLYSRAAVPKWVLTLLNQLFEIEEKLTAGENSDPSNCLRNVGKIKDALEEQGLFYEDPTGQPFNETRTDLEATISGTGTDNLRVVEVMKPIIREGTRDQSRVFQRGIVLVESEIAKREQ
ncbi:MAG: hypothetical protein HN742_04145 [Lentisphaerae bacterium]|jgi:hypothetical protein|nr:hypothetical protein [Verrucomicrobiota bacterium]MBT7841034.1 hypothetical protein [Lentisphaerota bacterium]